MLFGWSPVIGDPTPVGWMTVLAYAATALLAASAWALSVRRRGRPGIWPLATAALVGLGINKQLDLQTLIVSIGRRIAMAQGWYEDRAGVQIVFIAVLVVVAAIACAQVGRWARHGTRWERQALAGLVVLATFVVIRAASFHHVDSLLGVHLKGLRVNQLLELGGIALIAAPALMTCLIDRRKPMAA